MKSSVRVLWAYLPWRPCASFPSLQEASSTTLHSPWSRAPLQDDPPSGHLMLVSGPRAPTRHHTVLHGHSLFPLLANLAGHF